MSNQPLYGNYPGYYIKRPFLRDDRLELLPPHLFNNARVLDVGCNEGWVTCEIAQSYGAKYVVGVDIDDSLIQGAWRRRRAVWSRQQPTPIRSPSLQEGSLLAGDQPPDPPMKLRTNYFPASCEYEFGSLPIPPSEHRGKETFPHNLTFRTADWVKTTIPEDKDGYDVVVAFSVVKWIHLNQGDDGLKLFFQRVFKVLKPRGQFVLELQTWDSYTKAKRKDARLKDTAKHIEIKPDNFDGVLKAIGFCGFKQFRAVEAEGGPRFPAIHNVANSESFVQALKDGFTNIQSHDLDTDI